MQFSTEVFLFVFLPVVLILYYAVFVHFKNIRNIFLLLASLFFYAWGVDKYAFLMMAVILLNWLYGMLVDYYRDEKKKAKAVLTVMVITNIGILGYFKYSVFVARNISAWFHLGWNIRDIVLPLGISFFIFQAISYVVDVYRGKGAAQVNPLNVGLYIAFFPQLVNGPIVRYEKIADELTNRKERFEDFSTGACRFIIGLSKKVIIADNLKVVVDAAFARVIGGNYEASVLLAWMGAICFTLEIFFDFAGYSDMAIGLGRMFGFHFDENFNYPYIAQSVSEFWRRWHMSLQNWFRDYVYFPLGGSRVETKAKLVRNLFVVWMLTGIWHGANWTFFLWGFLYFVLLTIEKMTGLSRKLGWWGHLYTLFFVMIGWVIFRADSLGQMGVYLGAMFGRAKGGFAEGAVFEYLNQIKFYLLAAFVCCGPVIKNLDTKMKKYAWWNVAYILIMGGLLAISVSFMFNQSYSPFIYYNF